MREAEREENGREGARPSPVVIVASGAAGGRRRGKRKRRKRRGANGDVYVRVHKWRRRRESGAR